MRKVRKALITLTALSITLFGCTHFDDRGPDSANANNADILFVKLASLSNYTEISLGNLDTLKATDTAVKSFGAMMITDHTAANDELKAIAVPLGLTVIDTLDDTHQALRTQLSGLTGRAFDSVYIHSQVTDHQATIAAFQAEVANGEYAHLRAFANKQLPTLQEHLDKATTIAATF